MRQDSHRLSALAHSLKAAVGSYTPGVAAEPGIYTAVTASPRRDGAAAGAGSSDGGSRAEGTTTPPPPGISVASADWTLQQVKAALASGAAGPPGAAVAAASDSSAGGGGGGGAPAAGEPAELANLSLGAQLSDGRRAALWSATWERRPAVVKVLKREGLKSEEVLRTFSQEVAILAGLSHPSVVQLLGSGLHHGAPALVLEPLGSALHELLYPPGLVVGPGVPPPPLQPIPAAVIHRLVLQSAEALAYLHAFHVLHRDVRPATILLDSSGRAKLACFGASSRLERGHAREYTPEAPSYRYMAPEVISHLQCSEPSCDVFSFSLLLWEVTHRQVPFEGHSPVQAAFASAMSRLRPALRPRTELQGFAPIISACWEHTADQRPTMAQVVEQLHALAPSFAGAPGTALA